MAINQDITLWEILSPEIVLALGLALTTIVGVTAGVLISRPAFAKIIEIILKA